MDPIIRASAILAGGAVFLGAAIMLAAVAAIAEDDVRGGVTVFAVIAGVGAAALIALAVLNKLPSDKRP